MKPASNWSSQIIKSLLNLGVDKFCLAPGGRPTSLVNALDNFGITPSVHFDERGLGFYGLGYGKKNGKPAVVITTSGTAVGNLLPAVMEAYHSREPLIVVSTDLGWESSDSGANQSCKQSSLFSSFTNYSFDFPAVQGEFDSSALHSNLRQAVFKSLTGPVHLNFRFKPPFIEDSRSGQLKSEENEREKIYPAKSYPDEKEITDFCSELHQYKSGVVVIGQLPTYLDKNEIIDFCQHLKWPVFADVLSGLRGTFSNEFPMYLASEEIQEKLKPDCVLFLGGDILLRLPEAPFLRGVHKYLNQESVKRILVSDNPKRQDPFLNYDQRVFSSLDVFCKQVKKKLLATKKSGLYNDLENLENESRNKYDIFKDSLFSEFSCLRFLAQQLDSEKVFIGNSLAIRQLDCLLDKDLEVISAHGLKGIDGNLAMAAGFGADVVILGDTSFLHDLNSLSLFKEVKSIIVVLNNNGGHIFNYVEAKNTKNFESNYVNPHSMSFKNSAELFDLDYSKVANLEEFKQSYDRAKSGLKTHVIEVQSLPDNLQKNLINYFNALS